MKKYKCLLFYVKTHNSIDLNKTCKIKENVGSIFWISFFPPNVWVIIKWCNCLLTSIKYHYFKEIKEMKPDSYIDILLILCWNIWIFFQFTTNFLYATVFLSLWWVWKNSTNSRYFTRNLLFLLLIIEFVSIESNCNQSL